MCCFGDWWVLMFFQNRKYDPGSAQTKQLLKSLRGSWICSCNPPWGCDINKYIYIYMKTYISYIYIHKYYRDYEMCSKVFAASVHSPCTAFTLSVAPSDLALADTGRLWLWHQALLDRIACHGHALARALPAGPAALARKTSRPGEMIWYRIVWNV